MAASNYPNDDKEKSESSHKRSWCIDFMHPITNVFLKEAPATLDLSWMNKDQHFQVTGNQCLLNGICKLRLYQQWLSRNMNAKDADLFKTYVVDDSQMKYTVKDVKVCSIICI